MSKKIKLILAGITITAAAAGGTVAVTGGAQASPAAPAGWFHG